MATSGLLTQGLGFSASPSMVLTHGLSSGSSTTLTGSPLITVGLGYGADADTYIITRGLGLATPPTPRDTFLEAVVGAIEAIPEITGGVHFQRAHASVAPPFAVVSQITETDEWQSLDRNASRAMFARIEVQVDVYATGKKTSYTLGTSVFDALSDATLVFDEGTLLEIAQTSQYSEIDPDRTVNGQPLYRNLRTFTAIVQRLV